MDYSKVIDDLSHIMEQFFSSRGPLFEKVYSQISKQLKAGHKILVFGNGGSASQAQHFAAELVNKFLRTRPPIKAIALTTDTSVLTSIANDVSYDKVFSRQIEALGEPGDIALGLSTSGNSPNVILAIEMAKKQGLFTVALTGNKGGKLAPLPDILLDVPSESTPRIQEAHLILLHLLAEKLEEQRTVRSKE